MVPPTAARCRGLNCCARLKPWSRRATRLCSRGELLSEAVFLGSVEQQTCSTSSKPETMLILAKLLENPHTSNALPFLHTPPPPPTPHCCCLGRFVSKFPISHVCPVQSRFPECWGGFCLVLCSPCSQHRRWEGDAVPRHLCSCSWEETQPPRAASMDCADGPPSSR